MTTPRVAVVVGNPKPRSRTLAAATYVATKGLYVVAALLAALLVGRT